MTTVQLDNLLKFCFHFNSYMGSQIVDHDYDYIKEKWDKYIGFEPYENESLTIEEIKEYLRPSFMVGRGRSDIILVNQLLDWSNRWGKDNYSKIKEILHFILVVDNRNKVGTHIDVGMSIFEDFWCPSEMVDLFIEWVGDVNKINKEPYDSLHTNVRSQFEFWLNYDKNLRDYNLISILD